MVGAPGFEPGASCAQDRLTISCKSRIFKHSIANTNLSFVRDMWLDAPGCISLIAGYYKSHYSYCLERELRLKRVVRTVSINALILDEKNANKGTKRTTTRGNWYEHCEG